MFFFFINFQMMWIYLNEKKRIRKRTHLRIKRERDREKNMSFELTTKHACAHTWQFKTFISICRWLFLECIAVYVHCTECRLWSNWNKIRQFIFFSLQNLVKQFNGRKNAHIHTIYIRKKKIVTVVNIQHNYIKSFI